MKTFASLAVAVLLAVTACTPEEPPEDATTDAAPAEVSPVARPIRQGVQMAEDLEVQRQQARDRRAQLDQMFREPNR